MDRRRGRRGGGRAPGRKMIGGGGAAPGSPAAAAVPEGSSRTVRAHGARRCRRRSARCAARGALVRARCWKKAAANDSTVVTRHHIYGTAMVLGQTNCVAKLSCKCLGWETPRAARREPAVVVAVGSRNTSLSSARYYQRPPLRLIAPFPGPNRPSARHATAISRPCRPSDQSVPRNGPSSPPLWPYLGRHHLPAGACKIERKIQAAPPG